ncbi:MAG TPA: glycosyltransferase family 4 protein [Nevskiaceae bacterium]|nr:glycosyltransferase family 4 protein [Nevskiaceae bacterium]
MKIAMMVRGYIPAPRPLDIIYAPIDLAVALSEGLARRGHSVDFFGPLGTKLKHANVETLNLRPLARNQKELTELYHNLDLLTHDIPGLWDRSMVSEMFARAAKGQYDLLFFHHPEVALAAAKSNPSVPVVHVLNDPVYPWYREVFELYHSPNQHYISISNNQRRDAPDLPYAGTVYNGVDTDLFTTNGKAEDYLLTAGRIMPEKGFKEAIQVAQATNHRLLIIGPIYPQHQGYFDQYIKPHLNDKILYLGYIEQKHMKRYYQKAKAFLTPVQWEEPFGLTTLEALACGTPVITLNRGAAPEIIVDGKTGFVVDSIAEMCEAVQKVEQINRADCRAHVSAKFSHSNMVDEYETVFKQIIRDHKKKKPAQIVADTLKRVPEQIKKTITKQGK